MSGNQAEIESLFLAKAMEVLPEIGSGPMSAESSLEDLGASSLDRVEILLAVQEALGRKLPVAELTGRRSIAELARTVAGHLDG